MVSRTVGLGACLVLALTGGCSGSVKIGGGADSPTLKEARQTGRAKPLASGGEGELSYTAHCLANDPRHEVSEYDTSGDDIPDVRKVFLRVGEGSLARLVLVCRESDLNGDGVKDVVRYYSEEGRPLREESDRNFDGRMDAITIFQDGQILRQEFDDTGNGIVDTKVFYDAGRPLRAERDLAGRSTPQKWQADRWEYFEEGRVVRMGTDVDGDGTVDRWDRDSSLRRAPDLSGADPDADPA